MPLSRPEAIALVALTFRAEARGAIDLADWQQVFNIGNPSLVDPFLNAVRNQDLNGQRTAIAAIVDDIVSTRANTLAEAVVDQDDQIDLLEAAERIETIRTNGS